MSKRSAHFYLFYGDNEFQKNIAIQNLKERLLAKENNLNFRVFYGEDIGNDISPIVEFIGSFPFMAEKKLAVIKNSEKIAPDLLNSLLDYLKKPADFLFIVFTAQKPNFEIELFRYIRECGNAIQFKQPKESETLMWIKKTARQMKIEIDQQACAYLYYLVGNNLYELYSELQKLLSYYGENSHIGVEEVKLIASYSKEHTIFDLIDSISSKRLIESLKILSAYLEREGKDKTLLILSLIIRQLNLLLKTKQILKMGGDIKKLQHQLQPYSFLAKRLMEQARLWTEKEIEDAFLLLAEADSRIKSGASASFVLEDLIISLCN